MCINLGEPGGPDYVYDGILRHTLWMHKVSGGGGTAHVAGGQLLQQGKGER